MSENVCAVWLTHAAKNVKQENHSTDSLTSGKGQKYISHISY